MRDKLVYGFKRALPRMSWHPRNLFNLWQRTAGPKALEIQFKTAAPTLFAQRWRSKRVVRAYHGDYIPEKVFKRWYLPETLPDVRPKRVPPGDDTNELLVFAKRKSQEYHAKEETRGMAPVGSLMFQEVERRIDTIVFRSCFAESIYEARRLVVHGYVRLNGRKHMNANTRLAPGDMISVDPEAVRWVNKPKGRSKVDEPNGHWTPDRSLTRFHLPRYASPWLFIPPYIEPSFATCSAIYVRHPTARPGYSEIPTPYDAGGEVVQLAWEWYTKRRPRIRSRAQYSRMPEDRAFDPLLVERKVRQQLLWKSLARKKLLKKGMIVNV